MNDLYYDKPISATAKCFVYICGAITYVLEQSLLNTLQPNELCQALWEKFLLCHCTRTSNQ